MGCKILQRKITILKTSPWDGMQDSPREPYNLTNLPMEWDVRFSQGIVQSEIFQTSPWEVRLQSYVQPEKPQANLVF